MGKELRSWKPKKLGKIIATRQFTLIKGKTQKSAFLDLGIPLQEPNPKKNSPWACPLMIRGFGEDEFHYVMGIDGIQAINGAFYLALVLLDTYSKNRGYVIEFLDPRMPLIFEWFNLMDIKKAQKKQRQLFEKEEARLEKIFKTNRIQS